MDSFIYYTKLFDLYQNLLTEQEKKIFNLYFEENFSMQEIADLENISKARVGVIIKTIEKKLDDYESKLQFSKKVDLIIDKVDKEIEEKIINIIYDKED